MPLVDDKILDEIADKLQATVGKMLDAHDETNTNPREVGDEIKTKVEELLAEYPPDAVRGYCAGILTRCLIEHYAEYQMHKAMGGIIGSLIQAVGSAREKQQREQNPWAMPKSRDGFGE